MKALLIAIIGFITLSVFITVTDWLAINAGNIVGPLTLIGIVFALWRVLTLVGGRNNG